MTDRAKKLNREEKLQLQAEKLKEQAQIDLEGYVMCRSALRATRTDLHEESERYDRLREEYEELKNRRAPYKVLFYKRRRIRKCKKHIKELGRAKKRLRKQMKEHREGVRRRTVTNTFAFVAALAMFAMMAWRIWQLAQGVYYMAFYRNGEALEITAGCCAQAAPACGVHRIWPGSCMAIPAGVGNEAGRLEWCNKN